MLVRVLSQVLRWARRRRVVVFFGSALLGLACTPLLLQLSFDSNVLNLLPQDGPAVRGFRTYVENFGNMDRFYVLFEAPQDSFMSDHADFVSSYVQQLREAPEIASVDIGMGDEGADWAYLLDHELMLLGPDRVTEVFERFESDSMTRELSNARELLSIPSADVTALVRQDPLGLLSIVRDHLSTEVSVLGIDASQEGVFSPDGRSQLVVAKPVRPPFDTAFSRQLMQRLAAIGETVGAEGAVEDLSGPLQERPTVEIVGAYRSAVEIEDLIRTEGIITAAGALASVLIVVFLVFRDLRVLVCSAVPLLLAALATATLSGSFYQLSTAASGSAAMLFGVSIDGVLLLYFRYLEARRDGADSDEATGLMATTVISVGLGFTTTAATYFGLMATDLPSLVEVGRLIGIGILLSGVFTVLLVPGMLPETGRDVPLLTAHWVGRVVVSFRTPIIGIALLATVGLGMAATNLRVIPSLERLQPRTAAVRAEADLRERFSIRDEVVLVLAQGRDLEPLLESNQAVAEELQRRAPEVAASFPSTLIPPRTRQDAVHRAITTRQMSAGDMSKRLTQAATQAGFRPDAFSPFLAWLPRLLDPEQRITYQGYLDHGLRSMVERFVTSTTEGYMTVAYVYPQTPRELALIRSVIEGSGQAVDVTGVSLVNDELAATFAPRFIKGGLIGSLGVAAIVLIGFGSLHFTVLSLVPTALGLLWSAGILSLMQVELDLFSVFALLMGVGIGVDYSIHVVHRYSLETAAGVAATLHRVAPAILAACATTLVGFGSLMASTYRPLQSLGLVSVVTIAACLLTSMFVLPAYMSLVLDPDSR